MELLQVGQEGFEGHLVSGARLPGVVILNLTRYILIPALTNRSDCDPAGNGYIDREAFVQGMWRIDEELARKNALKRGVLQGRSVSGTAFRR